MRKILKQLRSVRGKTDTSLLSLSRFLFLLSLPTQFGVHYFFKSSYVYGLRVDYLSIAIYLSDILFLFYFMFYFKNLKLGAQLKRSRKYLVFFLGFILINILFSLNVPVTIFRWVKIVEWGSLVLIVSHDRKRLEARAWIPLFIGTIVVCAIAIAQFINGHTASGLAYFFGERTFNISTPGIALVNIFGQIRMRAYSIFSHPNSMAGFELIIFFLFLRWRRVSKLLLIGIMLSCVCILLSFSKTAFVTLFVSSLIYIFGEEKFVKHRRILITLLFVLSFVFLVVWRSTVFNFVLPFDLGKRGELFQTATELFVKRPLFGVGLGAFVGEYSTLQPVHNIFILILVETGIVGLIAFFVVLMKLVRKQQANFLFIALMAVLITGLFDHYSLTLQQNFLLTAFLTGLII